ncbi:MAG: hypothetical protein GY793_10185 [Proteobacteria bacterium]|nr:hypothetical protein [Pseudomonadota bacterium]
MAKRFTDNEKWKDAWFMDLPSKYKLFWLYLLDECNHAGIWKVNFKVASFHIGEHLEYSEVKRIMNGRITLLNDEKWYINKFIKYQYKCEIQGLSPKNNAHLSIIKILNEYDIFKPLTSPLLGAKDKDKDKDIINREKQIDLLDSINDVKNEYTQQKFLQRWKDARQHFDKQPTHISKLTNFELINFNNLKKTYKAEQFDMAIQGLFKQKTFPATRLRPTHFLELEHFEKYLTCFNTGEKLFSDNKKQINRI